MKSFLSETMMLQSPFTDSFVTRRRIYTSVFRSSHKYRKYHVARVLFIYFLQYSGGLDLYGSYHSSDCAKTCSCSFVWSVLIFLLRLNGRWAWKRELVKLVSCSKHYIIKFYVWDHELYKLFAGFGLIHGPSMLIYFLMTFFVNQRR